MLLLTYIVTINYICSSMNPYKTIRISKSVLSDLKALQKDGESIQDTIRRLHNDYLDCIEEITYRYSRDMMNDGSFTQYISITACEDSRYGLRYTEYFMNIGEDLYDIVRLPKDVLDEISWIPQHPDEIFNTTMFTVISIENALMEWNKEDKE
jgi:predicted CopG family antitoxin